MKIAAVITGLDPGGAEAMLLNLTRSLKTRDVELKVFVLSGGATLVPQFEAIGVEVICLGLRKGPGALCGLLSLSKKIRIFGPDLVHTWMPHADLIGGVASRMAGINAVIWSLHHADLSTKSLRTTTVFVLKINALLCRFVPEAIVAVSQHTLINHLKFGFSDSKLSVIHNGIDARRFKHHGTAKPLLRQEWQVNAGKKIIGFVGRFAVVKRVEDFLMATAQLMKENPGYHVVMVGSDLTWDNKQLVSWIENCGLDKNITLLGDRSDLPDVMSSFDLLGSTSADEAFGMVLIEAMATGCPCVATRSGGSEAVSGGLIPLAEVGNIAELQKQMTSQLNLASGELLSLRNAMRQHVLKNFSIETVTEQYLELYGELIQHDSTAQTTKPH